MENRIIIKCLNHTCRINNGVFSGCPYYIPLPGVGDFDVYVRGVAGKLDQVSGTGVDLYRGSHVQDEDFAAFGVDSYLEDKAYGLRDSHKVTDDIQMCDGDKAAFFNLALEQRDHASLLPRTFPNRTDTNSVPFPAFDVLLTLMVSRPRKSSTATFFILLKDTSPFTS